MTILSHCGVTRLLALSVLLILPATSSAQQRPPILEKLAKTYGLDSFGQIEAIRYTFNAEAPGLDLSRSWTWEPKTDQVTYEGKDKSGKPVKVTYLRSQLGSQTAEVKDDIDPGFVNDNYWLLLPIHLFWDTSARVEDAGMQKLPLGTGSAQKVAVKYPSDGGYSPGDTWELYVGSDGRIQEIAYHGGGPAKLEVIATWADYKKAGPLLLSLDHRGTPTASRCAFPSRMWPSSWRGRAPGSTRNNRRASIGRSLRSCRSCSVFGRSSLSVSGSW